MLTLAERGEVQRDANALVHPGIRPGQSTTLGLLPGRKAESKADKRQASWEELRDFLDGKANRAKPTIKEIGDAIASTGADAGRAGLEGR